MSRLTVSEIKLRNEMWQQGQLLCSQCKQFLPVKMFLRNGSKDRGSRTNYGYRYYCKECESKQRQDRKEAIKNQIKEKNVSLKSDFVLLAGGKCQRCGYDEFISGLEFHHVYVSEKEYNPSYIIYNNNFDATWKELDKCCLLCSCCHNGYEAGYWRAEFVKRDGLGWTVGSHLPLDDTRYESDNIPVYKQSVMPDSYRTKCAEQMILW